MLNRNSLDALRVMLGERVFRYYLKFKLSNLVAENSTASIREFPLLNLMAENTKKKPLVTVGSQEHIKERKEVNFRSPPP